MAPTELDLPLLPSADQIRRREFATIRRGYDPDQVREYLHQIASQVQMLEGELREARLSGPEEERVVTVTEPAPQEDPYERFSAKLADVLRAADEHAERIVQDAHEEAGRALSEARTEADRIRVDAQSRAEDARQQGTEVLTSAKREAERVLSSLSARRETLVEQLAQMQSHLLGVARDLEAAIDEPSAALPSPGSSPSSSAEPVPGTSVAREFDLLGDAVKPVPPGAASSPNVADTDEDVDSSADIDPRYEDLWVSNETVTLDLDDLALADDELDLGEPGVDPPVGD